MRELKKIVFFIFIMISVFCLIFILVKYFILFKQSKFDLPNRYVKEKAPLIIAASPSVVEVMESLTYKNIIGICSDAKPVTDYYKRITSIGFSKNPNMQIIKKLKSDFYLSDKNLTKKIETMFEKSQMETVQIKIFDFSTYKAFLNSISEMGRFLNKEKESNQIIQTIEAKILELRREIYGKENNKILVLFYNSGGVFLATKYSFIGSILDAMGIKNISNNFTEMESPYVYFDLKKIQEVKADIIISVTDSNFIYDFNINYNFKILQQKNEFIERLKFKCLKNNKNCLFYTFDKDNVSDLGVFKIPYIARKLKDIIYSDNK